MKKKDIRTTTAALLAALLTLAASSLPSLAGGFGRLGSEAPADARLAPALRDELRHLTRHPQYDQPIPVIVRMKPEFFASRENSSLRRGGPNALPLIGAFTGRLNSRQIRLLLDSDQVDYVTIDAVIRPSGKPTRTAGHDTAATIGAPLLHDMGFKGGGVTIAVFDSGVNPHADLPIKSRVRVAMDFTSGEPVKVKQRGSGYWENPDSYGHGTHVAGILGGDGKKSKGVHQGVAPKAKLVDIKVVGEDGTGLTSNLIKAIDWVIEHREEYEIRVANLSLGHPPIESYVNDPLGQAVERMVQAGIVTVASAGNFGKLDGVKIWGGISSPGNHPAVITVSATNTMGTDTHADDRAASFSSRGPTYIDELFKPDLTAPGNDIVSLSAPDSWIAKNYPELSVDNYYMRMSGSSMATAHVSGTVALMLSANPTLTPRAIKALLLLTAVKLTEPHMFEQGNGLVNAYGATIAATTLDAEDRLVVGTYSPTWELDGSTVWAGGAFAVSDKIVYSDLVLPESRGAFWGSGVEWCYHLVKTSDSSVGPFFLPSSGLWYTSDLSSDAVFWIENVFWSEGIFWMEGLLWVEGILWSDGIYWSNSLLQANNLNTHHLAGE